jgi:hypothetical protein
MSRPSRPGHRRSVSVAAGALHLERLVASEVPDSVAWLDKSVKGTDLTNQQDVMNYGQVTQVTNAQHHRSPWGKKG